MKMPRLASFFLVLMLLVQAGCAPPGVLYLTPGRYLAPIASGEDRAQIVLERFAESFSADEFLGQHLIGKREQSLKVKPTLVSGTIDTLLGDTLSNKNVVFTRGSGWDRGLAGLKTYEGRAALVLSGEITQFSIKAKTGLTRLTSTLDISMDIDCLVGFVDEGKIVRKTVHMDEKVLKFSANQKAMEKVVDTFLADVVEQIQKNIAEFVD